MIARWKAAVAAVVAAVLAWSGALLLGSWYAPAQSADLPIAGQQETEPVDLPILMYHHIHKDPDQWGAHVISPATLEGDFQYLKEHGYTTVTTAELIAYVREGKPLPEKPVMITFDDGQLSVLEYALPLLEQYDFQAVVAVVGAFADEYTRCNDRNVSYACMNWTDIGTLVQSRRVEIANHTYHMHELTPRNGCQIRSGESTEAYQAALTADLAKNEEKIRAATGKPPTSFAFPYGALCKEARQVLTQRGYQVAFTCTEEVNHLTGDPAQLCNLGRFNRANDRSREELFRAFS